ncbi:MAG: hypothetical protein AAB966_03665 [Patescibacteria group bacterium]
MKELKNKSIRFIGKHVNSLGSLLKYLLFILEILGWVVVLFFLTPGLAISFSNVFGKTVSVSDFVLFITAAFILAYTYETKKLREESVMQRKMAVASDIQFTMASAYRQILGNHIFAYMRAEKNTSNISQIFFIQALPARKIGYADTFRYRDDYSLITNYYIETLEDREAFLKTLEIKKGEISAWVLTTDGTEFLYTFKALEDNWKKALEKSNESAIDEFVLVKKELYWG